MLKLTKFKASVNDKSILNGLKFRNKSWRGTCNYGSKWLR